jgi:4-hydroxy-3-methylbut-2-enyl diphosphate reductase
VTQTTLSVSDARDIIAALRSRFPEIIGPDTRDICYATHNRQMAVLELARRVELIIVVGSRNSSNSNRLREIGDRAGVRSILVEDASAIEPEWIADLGVLGITAGASVPEALIEEAIERLATFRPISVELIEGVVEDVEFRLPPRLIAHEAIAAT